MTKKAIGRNHNYSGSFLTLSCCFNERDCLDELHMILLARGFGSKLPKHLQMECLVPWIATIPNINTARGSSSRASQNLTIRFSGRRISMQSQLSSLKKATQCSILIPTPWTFDLKGCSLDRSVGRSSRSLATQMPVAFSPKVTLRIRL